jgi:hypothetical protein
MVRYLERGTPVPHHCNGNMCLSFPNWLKLRLHKHRCLGSALPHLVLTKPDRNFVLPVQARQVDRFAEPSANLTRLDWRPSGGKCAPVWACQGSRSDHEVAWPLQVQTGQQDRRRSLVKGIAVTNCLPKLSFFGNRYLPAIEVV